MTAPTLSFPRSTSVTTRLREVFAESLTVARTLRASAQEIARLEREGYHPGEELEVDFSLCIPDPAALGAALADARAAGFEADDLHRAAQGTATVRSSVRLRALDLSRATARLSRVVERYEGFAEVIGPVGELEALGGIELGE